MNLVVFSVALIPRFSLPEFFAVATILAIDAAVVVGVILLIRFFIRNRSVTPELRLRKLDTLLSEGLITEAEYQDQRRRILSNI
jgi:hypothetical protein